MTNYYDPLIAADWLRTLRLTKGLTQLELAMDLGLSERTLRRYETDGLYNIDTIINIANYFNVDAFTVLFKAYSNQDKQEKSCLF